MTDWNGEENLGVVAAHEIDDPFMLKIRTWLMKKHVEALGKINQTMVVDAVSYVAYRDERDSLKDHVNRLPAWDGTPRISTWLVEGFGCEVNDEVGQTANYIKAVGKNLLIGMIARALDPGCKVDTMPIFYGPQGARKSSAMAVLATEEFFAEISEPPNSKDFYIGLQGIWLGEVAELASIASRAAEVEKVKGMVSRQRDRYRPPYAKNAQDFPRRIKFVGTTNALTFMRDETGNRRYPTLHVGNIDLDWIKANRDQLLAEALRDYRAGATWWDMPMDDHARVVEAHQTTASFHDDIAERLLDASLYDGTAEGPRGIAEDVAEPLDPQRMVERWGNVVTVMRVGIVWLGLTVAEVERQNRTIAATLRRLGWVTAHSSMRTVAGRRKAQRCWVVADKVERTRLRAAGELVGVTSPEPEIPF
jgi:predicted P-loop ATPase